VLMLRATRVICSNRRKRPPIRLTTSMATVYTSRALRHQQAHATHATQYMAAAADAAERGQWSAAARSARKAVEEAQRGVALRSTFTPAEWFVVCVANSDERVQPNSFVDILRPNGAIIGKRAAACTRSLSGTSRCSASTCASLRHAVCPTSHRRSRRGCRP